MIESCIYGSHRAGGGLPQPAANLNACMRALDTEALLEVSMLNLDATSMRQITNEAGGNPAGIEARIREIVASRGKMHNPVTNSGGVLVGTVVEIGSRFKNTGLKHGDVICPIVSLSLLPLQINAIHDINLKTGQIWLDGKAIIFSSTVFGLIPTDLPLHVAVGLIDIAGAPSQTLRLVSPGNRVAVLGAGKAGIMSALAARERLGRSGQLVVIDVNSGACQTVRRLNLADDVLELDLQDPLGAYRAVTHTTNGYLFDVVISVTSAANTEGAAILMCRDRGTVLFFGMATSFQTAALTAEGAGKDIDLLIGNGYVPGCVEDTLRLARSNPLVVGWLDAQAR